jgi:hypothetical protein
MSAASIAKVEANSASVDALSQLNMKVMPREILEVKL